MDGTGAFGSVVEVTRAGTRLPYPLLRTSTEGDAVRRAALVIRKNFGSISSEAEDADRLAVRAARLLGDRVSHEGDVRVMVRLVRLPGFEGLEVNGIEIERSESSGRVRQVYVKDGEGTKRTLAYHVRCSAERSGGFKEALELLTQVRAVLAEEGMTDTFAASLDRETKDLAAEAAQREEERLAPYAVGIGVGSLPSGNLTLILLVLEARADSLKREVSKIISQMEKAREADQEYEKWLEKKKEEIRQEKKVMQKKIDDLKTSLRQALAIPNLPEHIRGQIETLLDLTGNIEFLIEDLENIGTVHDFENRLDEINVETKEIDATFKDIKGEINDLRW